MLLGNAALNNRGLNQSITKIKLLLWNLHDRLHGEILLVNRSVNQSIESINNQLCQSIKQCTKMTESFNPPYFQ